MKIHLFAVYKDAKGVCNFYKQMFISNNDIQHKSDWNQMVGKVYSVIKIMNETPRATWEEGWTDVWQWFF